MADAGAKSYISAGARSDGRSSSRATESGTMPGWNFVKTSEAAAEGESLKRYQMQALSDVYRIVQSRLDSYRQSAGAIFIGVIAAILAFDSGLIRVTTDPSAFNPASYYPVSVVAGYGLLLSFIAFGGWYTIGIIGKYFAEMTAIVYRIDKMNRVWDADFWIRDEGAGSGEALFPQSFRQASMVGISEADKANKLEGWFDPAIMWFARFTFGLGVVHLVAYGFLVWHGMYAVAHPVQTKVAPPFQFYGRRMPPLQF
jgi:hypothetical protein